VKSTPVNEVVASAPASPSRLATSSGLDLVFLKWLWHLEDVLGKMGRMRRDGMLVARDGSPNEA
jgi:hypothetical protein